jgi:hypothetical protein
MRLTVYHDSNGNIVGLAASPADDSIPAEVVTRTQPGLRAAEIEVPPGVELDFDNPPRLNKELGKLAESYRIERGTLTRRS